MQGHPEVIAQLQALLRGELTAIDQYFAHSRMYANWGLSKLYTRINHETEEEKQHADLLIQRLLFLEVQPDLSQRDPLHIGDTVETMMEADLQLEYAVVKALREAIACCERAQDFVSRRMLQHLLDETEEDHAWWLEQQLWLIAQMGRQNYLQAQQ